MNLDFILKHLLAFAVINLGFLVAAEWSTSTTWLWFLFPFALWIPLFVFMDLRQWVKGTVSTDSKDGVKK